MQYKHNQPRPDRAGDEAPADGIIEGRNAVIEALRAGTQIDKIFIMKGEVDTALGHIASTARSQGIVVADADKRKLDGMSRTHAHQGVIAVAAVRAYATVEDILQAARDKGEPPLLVVCDELSDPHNLGAVSHLPVARVANLPSLLKRLKEEGLWIFGSAADGTTSLYAADLKGPAALVIGSEGSGMSRLVSETCDFLVRIPMRGKLNSLNASAAAAILLYEAVRQRRG